MSKSVSDKLSAARCRLLTCAPWYGHMSMSIIWKEDQMEWIPEEMRTMGVTMRKNGDIICFYYPPFVESRTLKQLYGCIQHEIEHLVRLHPIRIGTRDHMAFNIACDMVVNGKKSSPRIGYKDDKKVILPLEPKEKLKLGSGKTREIGGLVHLPEDFVENMTAEEAYDKVMDKVASRCPRCGAPKNSEKNKNEGNSDSSKNGEKKQNSGKGKEEKKEDGNSSQEDGKSG